MNESAMPPDATSVATMALAHLILSSRSPRILDVVHFYVQASQHNDVFLFTAHSRSVPLNLLCNCKEWLIKSYYRNLIRVNLVH